MKISQRQHFSISNRLHYFVKVLFNFSRKVYMLLCIFFFFFFLVIYVIDLNICCLLHDCCFIIQPKHPLGFVVGGTKFHNEFLVLIYSFSCDEVLKGGGRGEEAVNLYIFQLQRFYEHTQFYTQFNTQYFHIGPSLILFLSYTNYNLTL